MTILRLWRILHGLTLEELGKRLGVHLQTLWRVETRRAAASPELQARIAELLRMPLRRVFDERGYAR